MGDEGAGQWVTINGTHIFIHEGENEKSVRARLSQVRFSKEKMDTALREEAVIARALRGKNLDDNEAFDVISGKDAIEVKTIIDGKNPKITMRADALARKLDFAESNGYTAHTVVIDTRSGRPEYYYKEGVGSFRLGAMQRTSLGNLGRLIRG